MIRFRMSAHRSSRRRMAGLSLIEMMIALVMALIVAAGIITVFASTSSSNKVQVQMATLQETGRFAIHSLRTDLADANGNYCSNTGGNAGVTSSGLYLDALRSPLIYANDLPTVNAVFHDNTTSILGDAPTGAYSLPSFLYMRGYDCNTTTCSPSLASIVPSDLPAMGKAVGDRVPGADVLTLRYLKPNSGWAVVPATAASGTKITAGGDGTVTTIALDPLAGEGPITDFTGTLAMLADCSNAQVFAVTDAGGVLTPAAANYAKPMDITSGAAPRIFNFSTDFQTITYWLKVVSTGDGHTTGELERRVNGVDQPLVRGVERLDFSYGIIKADGTTEFLTANQVDTATDSAGSIPCHVAAPTFTSDVTVPAGMPDGGCLWRVIQTIQVHVLMDGQTPLYTLTPQEMYYIYSPDGGTTPSDPSTHAIKPYTDQGFPKQLLRREFTTLVSLRNYNP